MNAVLYLLIRQYRNRIIRLFRKPLSAILTILAALGMLSGPILFFIVPYKGLVGEQSRGIVIAAVQLFIGFVLLTSALSQQGGLFGYAEANLLFTAPFTKRTVLLYSTMQTAPASILTALFMSFCLPFFIGSVMTAPKFILTMLVMALMIFCVYILYYYIYIQEIAHPGLKKRLKKFVWLLVALPVLIFAILWAMNGHNAENAAIELFGSPVYNAVPVFGWAKWAVISLLNGIYLTGFLPAFLLLLASCCLLAKIYYSQDVEFYEQAQLDSIRLQKMTENIRSGGYDASGLTVKKVHRTKASFRPGAAAILSRQFLEMQKRGPVVAVRELLSGGIYIAMGLAMGFQFNMVFSLLLFTMIMGTMTDGWNVEFRKPFIYLIPENSFKKIIYLVLPGFFKTIASGEIILLAAAVLFAQKPLDIACYLLLMASYAMLFVAAGVFTYRILGGMTNAIVITFLRMIFMILAAVPGGVLAVILYIVTGSAGLPVITLAMVLANLASAALLLFLSRGIFERSELMNTV